MSCLLAALLMLGFPGPGLVLGATPTATNPSGSLSVDSDPAGAVVLLDGQAQGTTPLALSALPAGDHRVRVAKEGYLDNSRVVRVGGGQTERVRVRLTPAATTAATAQVENQPAEKKGGSSKKWVFIGLGAAATGAGAYFLLTKNGPPVPGTIGVSPGGTGMAGITTYTFTSQGSSDPDNDTLTYEWAFGDGATGSGQSATHVYASAGSYNVTLTVKDKKHSVSAPGASVTVARDMAGSWTGASNTIFSSAFGSTSMAVNLTQSGTSIGGTMTFSGGLTGTVNLASGGSISERGYPTNVTFTTANFTIPALASSFTVRFTGTTDASGTTMTGTVVTTQVGFSTFQNTTEFRR
jgi:hypothetical protein